jgi:hypothetical protein
MRAHILVQLSEIKDKVKASCSIIKIIFIKANGKII